MFCIATTVDIQMYEIMLDQKSNSSKVLVENPGCDVAGTPKQ